MRREIIAAALIIGFAAPARAQDADSTVAPPRRPRPTAAAPT